VSANFYHINSPVRRQRKLEVKVRNSKQIQTIQKGVCGNNSENSPLPCGGHREKMDNLCELCVSVVKIESEDSSFEF
jgi:hypothetical protein